MAYYKNFEKPETKHERFQNAEKTNYDPEGYTPVKSISDYQKEMFNKNMEQYARFISWARFYPDLLLDLLRPRTGGINLHFDQRVFLRSMLRFFGLYGVFPRGWGKTHNEVLASFVVCMLYPGSQIALTAQTKESAAKLLRDKYNEITDQFPLIKNEIVNVKQTKDDISYEFSNGSRLTNLANNDSSKGQRRTRLEIEEAALLNAVVFDDALKPVANTRRMTKGKLGIVDPLELNGQINFFTTAGFRGSTEFTRCLSMYKNMLDLTGDFVIGANWMLASWFGRSTAKDVMIKEKRDGSQIAFAQNYESKWVGATENQLVDINKLMNIRVLTKPVFENKDKKKEIILGVDVARSASSNNNKTVISVVEEEHGITGLIKRLKLVNMYMISNQLNFTAQACLVKKIQQQFNAKIVVVDTNGLGQGLRDELFKPNIDILTGEEYEAWDAVNGDYHSDYENAKELLYALVAKAQSTTEGSNSEIIVNFISCVESRKLQLLEQKKESDFNILDKEGLEQFAPYEQTNALIDEIANLKLKHLNNGGLTVEQVLSKIDKDRYSSLAYVLWWAMTYDNKIIQDGNDLLMTIAKMNSIGNNKISGNLQNIFQ